MHFLSLQLINVLDTFKHTFHYNLICHLLKNLCVCVGGLFQLYLIGTLDSNPGRAMWHPQIFEINLCLKHNIIGTVNVKYPFHISFHTCWLHRRTSAVAVNVWMFCSSVTTNELLTIYSEEQKWSQLKQVIFFQCRFKVLQLVIAVDPHIKSSLRIGMLKTNTEIYLLIMRLKAWYRHNTL